MLQLGGETDLAHESIDADRAGELGEQYLDRDGAVVADVHGEPDRRHTAVAKLALHGVPIAENCVEVLAHWARAGPKREATRKRIRSTRAVRQLASPAHAVRRPAFTRSRSLVITSIRRANAIERTCALCVTNCVSTYRCGFASSWMDTSLLRAERSTTDRGSIEIPSPAATHPMMPSIVPNSIGLSTEAPSSPR